MSPESVLTITQFEQPLLIEREGESPFLGLLRVEEILDELKTLPSQFQGREIGAIFGLLKALKTEFGEDDFRTQKVEEAIERTREEISIPTSNLQFPFLLVLLHHHQLLPKDWSFDQLPELTRELPESLKTSDLEELFPVTIIDILTAKRISVWETLKGEKEDSIESARKEAQAEILNDYCRLVIVNLLKEKGLKFKRIIETVWPLTIYSRDNQPARGTVERWIGKGGKRVIPSSITTIMREGKFNLERRLEDLEQAGIIDKLWPTATIGLNQKTVIFWLKRVQELGVLEHYTSPRRLGGLAFADCYGYDEGEQLGFSLSFYPDGNLRQASYLDDDERADKLLRLFLPEEPSQEEEEAFGSSILEDFRRTRVGEKAILEVAFLMIVGQIARAEEKLEEYKAEEVLVVSEERIPENMAQLETTIIECQEFMETFMENVFDPFFREEGITRIEDKLTVFNFVTDRTVASHGGKEIWSDLISLLTTGNEYLSAQPSRFLEIGLRQEAESHSGQREQP